jgi:hypothetical protein
MNSGFELFGRLRLIRVDQLAVDLWLLAACLGVDRVVGGI